MSLRAKTSGPEAGISIVEVLISLIIFTVGALAAVEQSITARQHARVGEYVTEAAAAAQYQMEALRALPYDDISSGTSTVWGFPLAWTVTEPAGKIIVLTVHRPTVLGGVTVDSFVTYAASIFEEQ